MICIEFPPVNTTGNYRSAGFARYLLAQGIETHILTTEVKSGIDVFNKSFDLNLLKGLESAEIHRFNVKPLKKFWQTKIGSFLRIWWHTTDSIDKRWYYGRNKTRIFQLVKEIRPDVIYVTLPPFSVSRVALDLSRKFNIPLVSDFRDAWSLWGTSPYSTKWHYKKVLNLERELISQSECVIGVTPELVDDLKKSHRQIKGTNYKVVYNGYDSGLNVAATPKQQNHITNIVRVGYVGSFYYQPKSPIRWYRIDKRLLKQISYSPREEDWKYRSPYFFLKTLSKLKERNPKVAARVEFHLAGKKPIWLDSMLSELDVEANFVYHGFLKKEEVILLQNSWDILLATSERILGGKHFCLPSKTFDYISSKKPIWAFITDGTQKIFFNDYSQVKLFKPDDVEYNVEQIERIIDLNLFRKVEATPLAKEYSRAYQSSHLQSILNSVLTR